MYWGSQENPKGPKQSKGTEVFNESGADSDWECKPPCAPFPNSCHPTVIGWEGNAPSCLHSPIRSQLLHPAHRWSESSAIRLRLQSHWIKIGNTDEAFQERFFLWEREASIGVDFDLCNYQDLLHTKEPIYTVKPLMKGYTIYCILYIVRFDSCGCIWSHTHNTAVNHNAVIGCIGECWGVGARGNLLVSLELDVLTRWPWYLSEAGGTVGHRGSGFWESRSFQLPRTLQLVTYTQAYTHKGDMTLTWRNWKRKCAKG